MSEITQAPRRVDLRQTRAVSGLVLRGIVAGTKTTARIAWAVLKSLGNLAVFLLVAAGGVAAIRYAGQILLSDDGTLLHRIAEMQPNPFAVPESVDSQRFNALLGFGAGMFLVMAGGAHIVWWCRVTWDALFHGPDYRDVA